MHACHEIGTEARAPAISYIGIEPPGNHEILWPNNLIAYGGSQLACYEPMLGYFHEGFARNNLIPGPSDQVVDGVFNMKNPACYLYPVQNRCPSQLQFRRDQRDALGAFLHYRPFPFAESFAQRIANWLTGATLFFLLGVAAASSPLYRKSRGTRN